jgi:hypothetical protein
MEKRRPPFIPGLALKRRTWRQKWYYLPDDERAQLRQRYNNDKDAYFAAFRLDDTDLDTILELGMAFFTKLESRLLRNLQRDRYRRRADLACSDLVQKMADRSHAPDLIFVAMDFEGDVAKNKGVTELGLAKFEVGNAQRGIQGTNISTSCHRGRRDYLFGNHMRIDIAQLPAMIVSELSEKQIVLVGHSIGSELVTMRHLGVPIEDLPNVIGSEYITFLPHGFGNTC